MDDTASGIPSQAGDTDGATRSSGPEPAMQRFGEQPQVGWGFPLGEDGCPLSGMQPAASDRQEQGAAGWRGSNGYSGGGEPEASQLPNPFLWHRQMGELQAWEPSGAACTTHAQFSSPPTPGDEAAGQQQQQQQQRRRHQLPTALPPHGWQALTAAFRQSDSGYRAEMMPPPARRSVDSIRRRRSSASGSSFDLRRTSCDTGSWRSSSTATPRGSLCGEAMGSRAASFTGDEVRRSWTADDAAGLPLSDILQQARFSMCAVPAGAFQPAHVQEPVGGQSSQDCKKRRMSFDGSMPTDSANLSTELTGSEGGLAADRDGPAAATDTSKRKKKSQEQTSQIRKLEAEAEQLAGVRQDLESRIAAANQEVERLQGREMELLAIQRIFDSEKKSLLAELAQHADETSDDTAHRLAPDCTSRYD